ncbi:MAG: Cys-tRNA(Pro) deacylase [Bacteroidales bacterium]|nr:Cys-tRNA(Pro) deacylase [Bacteroidales bacterium]MDY2916551.1 Cys-tRNA(Pro) deacylase [Muribaculaceae bacterium]
MSKKDKGAAKTNAVRLLEKAGVTFETKEYPVDEEHLDARHVADGVGEDISLVFKTLVLKGERTGLFVCVIPGAEEVDLKKAARAAGDKKAEMLPMKELLPATGYIRGGCSPVGMKKPLPTFFHVSALDHPKIYVSAGQRGMQLIIAPQDLINFVGGTAVDLIKD